MSRWMLLAAALVAAGGCSTETRLLDPVHTPLVQISPESRRAEPVRESGELPPGSPGVEERRTFGP
jgi:hypothetical protein